MPQRRLPARHPAREHGRTAQPLAGSAGLQRRSRDAITHEGDTNVQSFPTQLCDGIDERVEPFVVDQRAHGSDPEPLHREAHGGPGLRRLQSEADERGVHSIRNHRYPTRRNPALEEVLPQRLAEGHHVVGSEHQLRLLRPEQGVPLALRSCFTIGHREGDQPGLLQLSAYLVHPREPQRSRDGLGHQCVGVVGGGVQQRGVEHLRDPESAAHHLLQPLGWSGAGSGGQDAAVAHPTHHVDGAGEGPAHRHRVPDPGHGFDRDALIEQRPQDRVRTDRVAARGVRHGVGQHVQGAGATRSRGAFTTLRVSGRRQPEARLHHGALRDQPRPVAQPRRGVTGEGDGVRDVPAAPRPTRLRRRRCRGQTPRDALRAAELHGELSCQPSTERGPWRGRARQQGRGLVGEVGDELGERRSNARPSRGAQPDQAGRGGAEAGWHAPRGLDHEEHRVVDSVAERGPAEEEAVSRHFCQPAIAEPFSHGTPLRGARGTDQPACRCRRAPPPIHPAPGRP